MKNLQTAVFFCNFAVELSLTVLNRFNLWKIKL